MVLTDMPELMAELEVALTKQTNFVEQGTPQQADPDEASLPWSEGAARAIRRLRKALDGDPRSRAAELLADWTTTMRRPDLGNLVAGVTAAATAAHALIAPPTVLTYYGPCPTCTRDLYQEHVWADGVVSCKACGYAAPKGEHLRRSLDAMADRQMTLGGIVRTFNDAGLQVTRQRLENLIYRRGLPRQQVTRPPRWVGEGESRRLVPAEKVWMYRIGDVKAWLEP